MVEITDLTGIQESKRKLVIACLDDLLTLKDEQKRPMPVIAGHNWYNSLPQSNSVVTFANIHETEAYKEAMMQDLEKQGYDRRTVMNSIRAKGGAFLWNLGYRIRDDNGVPLAGLKIKDLKTGEYLDLTKFDKPLSNYPSFARRKNDFVAEDTGWELDIPFGSKEELFRLVNLFQAKAGIRKYDENGQIVDETEEEKKLRAPWTDAYEVPVLLVGENAIQYAAELPHFTPATKIALKENGNEISFVINKKLRLLKGLPHYQQLIDLGFKEEPCLGNKPFIMDIDKKQ